MYCGTGLDRTIAGDSWNLSSDKWDPCAEPGVSGWDSRWGDGDGFSDPALPCDPGDGNWGEDGLLSTPKIGVSGG